eukprot:Selendium_serpulae@DN1659_c0_g1_i1.p1
MEVVNNKAAKEIFIFNNSKPENKSRTNPQIDLHGLYVKEAQLYLTQALNSFEKNGKNKTLTIITGAGNHSHRNKPKIKPLTVEVLTKRGLSFVEKNVGTLEVQKPEQRRGWLSWLCHQLFIKD